MTLQQPTATPTTVSHPLLRVLVIAVLLVAAIIAVTAIVGTATTGPSYEIVPDPAGLALPF